MNIIQNIKIISQKIKKYDHLRCTLYICLAAILTLVLSLIIKDPSWKSILQNIFAGFITGVVISLISSYKNKGLKDREIVKDYLETIRNQYNSYWTLFGEYRRNKHSQVDIYYETTYDLIDGMDAIESLLESADNNERLVRLLKNKPTVYFNEAFGYNFAEQKKRQKELYDILDSGNIYDDANRKVIDSKIKVIDKYYRELMRKVNNREYDLSEEKLEIETSIP